MADEYIPPALMQGGGGGLFGTGGGWDDPVTQGLLSMGQSFFAGQGPSGFGQGYQNAQKFNQDRMLEQQKLKALQQQNADNEQFAPLLQNPNAFSPDQIEAVGMKAGISGHPGAATLMNIAAKMREKQDLDKQFGMMKSGDGYGGLFSSLADSPHVGEEAQAFQSRIDKMDKGDPRLIQKEYDRLRDLHFRSVEASNKREQEPLVAVMDPKTNRAKFVRRSEAEGMTPANAAGSTNVVSPENAGLTGDEYLSKLPLGMQGLVKKVANYEIDPKTFSTRGGQREQILAHVAQYDPSFDQKTYNTRYNAINKFATGQQGNVTRSLNVAIEHMDTARRLGQALENKDVPAFNALSQTLAQATGSPAPTNFDSVKDILADEVVKGVLGGPGAAEDRAKMADKIKRSSSPRQLMGALDSWTELLGGQLKGLEKQYEGATGLTDFRNRYLSQRAKQALSGKQPAATTGWSDDKEQRYQELLRKRNGS